MKGKTVWVLAVIAGVVLSVAYICSRVCAELDVLYGFDNVHRLRQTLKEGAYYRPTSFTQDGKDYVGVMLRPAKFSELLKGTRLFHQAAPFYIFDSDGQKVDFTRNHNDDPSFWRRWPGLFRAMGLQWADPVE